MENKLMILGLQKACVLLHALAYKFDDVRDKKETLALVECISEAIKKLHGDETKVTSAGEIIEDGIMRNTPWNG